MRNNIKIIAEIIAVIASLFGLYKGNVIELQTAIAIGLNIIVILICFQELSKGIEKDMQKLGKTIHHIEIFCARIREFLKYQFPKRFNAIYKELEEKRSPSRLTSLGEKILNDSEIKEFINNNLEYLIKKLEQEKPLTAFDVEHESFDVLMGEVDNPKLKNRLVP